MIAAERPARSRKTRPILCTASLLAAACALLLVGACHVDLTVPNLNQVGAGGEATRSTVVAGAQGLLLQVRGMSTGGTMFSVWGREAYVLSASEPRYVNDYLVYTRGPASFGSGSAFNYGVLVNARALLDAVDVAANMSDAEREGVRGWAKTVAGFAYSQTAMVYPEFGAPLEPPANPTGPLAPIATGPELYDRAIALLDEGYVHLQHADTSFVFGLTPGMAGFDRPLTFAKVNRALKARTLKYRGDFPGVLAALRQSFVDADADLALGAYHSFSLADKSPNPLYQPPLVYVHPRILADAQLQANGQKDRRATSKTKAATPFFLLGITATERPNIFPTNVSPFPWITNEELLLLRAEARLATGDAAGALADVNVIRTKAGGLPPIAGLTGDGLLTEILYEKLYSLLLLGGYSYFDAKQYGRLDMLPRALPGHVVYDRVNWPTSECASRRMTDGPCGTVVGR